MTLRLDCARCGEYMTRQLIAGEWEEGDPVGCWVCPSCYSQEIRAVSNVANLAINQPASQPKIAVAGPAHAEGVLRHPAGAAHVITIPIDEAEDELDESEAVAWAAHLRDVMAD